MIFGQQSQIRQTTPELKQTQAPNQCNRPETRATKAKFMIISCIYNAFKFIKFVVPGFYFRWEKLFGETGSAPLRQTFANDYFVKFVI